MSIQKIAKDAKTEVDECVEEVKQSPEPLEKDLWTDIYYKGTEPPFMRGREREEVSSSFHVKNKSESDYRYTIISLKFLS